MLTLKRAEAGNARLLFDWVNDKEVRNNSIRTAPIEWEEHLRWLNQKLSDENCIIYIGYDKDEPVGQVRFDKEGDTYFIDYSVDKNYRGKGLAKVILSNAIQELNALKGGKKTVKGMVKKMNLASVKIFEALGFSETTTAADAANGLKAFSRIEL